MVHCNAACQLLLPGRKIYSKKEAPSLLEGVNHILVNILINIFVQLQT